MTGGMALGVVVVVVASAVRMLLADRAAGRAAHAALLRVQRRGVQTAGVAEVFPAAERK
mgnify:CR=1 FL=1